MGIYHLSAIPVISEANIFINRLAVPLTFKNVNGLVIEAKFFSQSAIPLLRAAAADGLLSIIWFTWTNYLIQIEVVVHVLLKLVIFLSKQKLQDKTSSELLVAPRNIAGGNVPCFPLSGLNFFRNSFEIYNRF